MTAMDNAGTGFVVVALRMSAGIVIWGLHFAAIYGLTALACARGMPAWPPLVVAIATTVALVALAVVFVRGWRRRGEFEWWMSAAAAAFAIVAVVWEAVPALIVPACR
jgi:hypothetical protein